VLDGGQLEEADVPAELLHAADVADSRTRGPAAMEIANLVIALSCGYGECVISRAPTRYDRQRG
jgi:hypothetical protein